MDIIIKALAERTSLILMVLGVSISLLVGVFTYRYFRSTLPSEKEHPIETREVSDVPSTPTSSLFSYFIEDTETFGQAATSENDIDVDNADTLYYLISGTVEVYYKKKLLMERKKDFFVTTILWLISEQKTPSITYRIKKKSVFYQITNWKKKKILYILLSKFFRSTLYTLLNYVEVSPYPYDVRRIDALSEKNTDKILEHIKKTLCIGREVKRWQIIENPKILSRNSLYYVVSGSPTIFYEKDSHDLLPGDVVGLINRVSILKRERKIEKECVLLEIQMSPYIKNEPEPLISIAKEYSHLLTELVQVTDSLVEWRIMEPGERISAITPTNSIKLITCGYFLKEGDIKYFGIGSNKVLFEREAILHEESAYVAIATRISEIIEIPPEYIDTLFSFFESIMIHLYKRIISRIGTEEELDPPSLITFIPSNVKETQIEVFTYFLDMEINQSDSCIVLSSSKIEDMLGSLLFEPTRKLSLISVISAFQSEHDYILLPIIEDASTMKMPKSSSEASLSLSEIIFYLVPNGNSCDLEMEKKWCKVDTVVLHRTSMRKVSQGRYYGQRHHVEFPAIDIPVCVIQNRFHEAKDTRRSHCNFTEASPYLAMPIFPLDDLKRFLRTLKGENIGLVLGGGGARGISHIGIIQALEEAGIPIDAVGGTSMGAFVGALYATGCSNREVFIKAKYLSRLVGSIWRIFLDMTYPICSMFTGKTFNETLGKIFKSQKIEDLWLPYYCVTTDISGLEEKVHTYGLLWRYVRASMSLAGYLPPLCDKGSFLLDGGYTNNVPVDAMRSMGIRNIIAVDVGSELESSYYDYGDSLNGFWVILQKLFGTKRFLSLTEIQYRLSYITSTYKEKRTRSNLTIKYIRPDLGGYRTMDFSQFDEIVAQGYQYGKKIIAQWKESGEYVELTRLGTAYPKERRNYTVAKHTISP
ncbi:lysophospholipid hydrolase [Nematocida sp. LUAm3]|nr:lysophospholipid hydrolase [Nematocida sp. LUAm3]KAI5173721.1 lysophospholipid hydrolase [Nematocida sp. LUAm2]KAI5176943.1 lysophospholipid hydrolase [Nematocida sp. LUAm1]